MKRPLLAAGAAGALLLGFVLFRSLPPPGSENPASRDDRAGWHETTAAADFVESRADPLPEASGDFPDRAAAIADMPRDTERETAIRELARDWTAQNPVEAERWAAAIEDSSERERALTHVCLEASARDPRDAAEMARWRRLNAGVVDAIAGRWAEADFHAAMEWAAALPDDGTRERILASVVLSRAATAPDEAAQIVAESFEAGEIQEEAAMAVLHRWLLDDPEAAREWVAMFPAGSFKERAEEEARGVAVYRDTGAAE